MSSGAQPHHEVAVPHDHRITLPHSGQPVTLSASEGYDRWASTYDQSPNPIIAREKRYLLPLLPDVCKKRVLDLGCGTGRWLEEFVARGAKQAVGVDLSARMLEAARAKAVPPAYLTRSDSCAVPFRAKVFDFAICSFVLGHIFEWKQVIRELTRVMKPGADLFVTDLHPDAYRMGWRTGFRDRDVSVQIYSIPRTAEEMVCAFHAGGFECLTHLTLCLGKAEKPIFARANRAQLFAAASRVPAVLVCHFRRLASRHATSRRTGL